MGSLSVLTRQCIERFGVAGRRVKDGVVGSEEFVVGAGGANLEGAVAPRVNEVWGAEAVEKALIRAEGGMRRREDDEVHRVAASEDAGEVTVVADGMAWALAEQAHILAEQAVEGRDVVGSIGGRGVEFFRQW